jgi:hypothetical protein
MVSDHPPGRQSSEGVPFDIPSCILLFGVYKIETKNSVYQQDGRASQPLPECIHQKKVNS